MFRAMANTRDEPRFPDALQDYIRRMQSSQHRAHACRARTPEDVEAWQSTARPALRRLVGLDRIAAQAQGYSGLVHVEDAEDLGDVTRAKGCIETEPGVQLPFWLLRPHGNGPFPLAVTPHGHDSRGFDSSAGIPHDGWTMDHILSEDRDVAVQAARDGFLAIAPATRGIAVGGLEDVDARYGKNCRAHALHCMMAGRTSIGERVWDMQRIVDWATQRPDVDGRHILMLGNSGGGVVTLYAAACDTRIGIAIPSCAFNQLVTPDGRMNHCDCNVVPGILGFGEVWDIAGLICPRHLLIVNGRTDEGRTGEPVDTAFENVRTIYAAGGAKRRADLQYGDAGHRFYKDLMWPFVHAALDKL